MQIIQYNIRWKKYFANKHIHFEFYKRFPERFQGENNSWPVQHVPYKPTPRVISPKREESKTALLRRKFNNSTITFYNPRIRDLRKQDDECHKSNDQTVRCPIGDWRQSNTLMRKAHTYLIIHIHKHKGGKSRNGIFILNDSRKRTERKQARYNLRASERGRVSGVIKSECRFVIEC